MKRRILSIITALALCLSLCPTWALAAEADPSLCKHHPEHTEDCGYTAPTEGHDCGHRHTAECYTKGVLPDADGGDYYEIGADTENLLDCQHSHDSECGYVEADPGAPCGYVCHICPIEDLIAALPEQVTEDNADDVRAQLDHILDLYRELDEGEQEEIDLSRVTKLQEALDVANAPMQAAGEINISQNSQNKLTEEDGDCPGHTFTGTAQTAMIYVESGAHNVTFSRLNITGAAYVGIAPGATMNLTLEDSNTIKGFECGIYVPKGATLVTTAESAGSLDVSGPCSAGIGGSLYDLNSNDGDIDCGTVIINGGNITATGGSAGYASAGIGGAAGDNTNDGNGGNITINGGKVTAKGGYDGVSNAPGIGGSTSAKSDGTLTISSADVLDGNTTLGAKGTYTITGDPTADMIVVPEGLVYTGQALDVSGIKIDDTKTGTGTYFGQTFTVNASADGWVLQDLSEVVNAGTYTATFKKGDKEISKTFTVAQSGTDLTSEGKVLTYNGSEETTSFSAGDTITVKATPTATGDAPQKAAARLRGGEPTAGQMAVYVGTTQVSVPANKGEDGSYTMTVPAADVLIYGQKGENWKYTLIAKFVGNTNMADAEAQVEVTITPNPLTADMVTLSEESGTYSGTEQKPTVTVTGLTEGTDYDITYTGNFTSAGDHTLTVSGKGIYRGTVEKTYTIGKATPTIAWANNVVTLTYTGQPADIKPVITLVNGETFSGTITYHHTNKDSSESGESKAGLPTNAGIYVVGARIPEQDNYTAATTASLMLMINKADQTVPAAPTADEENIKDTSITLDTIENAEYKRDDGEWQDSPVFTDLSPNTPYTFHVRLKGDDNHNASPSSGAASITTRKTLLDGAAVTVTGTYTYTGAAIVPEAGNVTAELNGTTINSDQYTISATGNVNAGTATVTITARESGDYSGSASTTFTISPATPTLAWGNTTQELPYTGQQAAITAPTVKLVGSENYSGTFNYSYAVSGSDSFTPGLPTDAGTYTVKASIAAQGNYTAADSTNTLTLTIKPTPVTLTFANQTIAYGDTPTGATADPASAKIEYSYTTEADGTPISGWPTNAGTYTVTAKVEATGNYGEATATAQLVINKAALTITGATVASKTYDTTKTATVSVVTFDGLKNGETLAFGADYTATGEFDNASAGTGKSVTVTVTLTGDKVKNYSLTTNTTTATSDINRASSSITKAPTATGITYGQALSDSTLTGGTGSVAGAFSWTAPATKPSAGTAQFSVTFTPTDTNYNTATVNVSVTVAKATPTLASPTASAIEYGQKLSDSTLTGGTATNPNGNAAVAGNWSWASGNTRPTATGAFPVAFVPSDTANYNTPENVDTSVTVNPAAPKLTLTAPAYQIAGGEVTVTCKVENPHDAAFTEAIPEAVTLTYTIGGETKPVDANGKFTIPEGTAKDTVITITASTAAVDGKYTAATKTATVSVTDKIPVEISGVGVTGRAYNGKAINHTGTPVIKTLDGKTVTDATVTYTWNTSDGTAPANAGSYTLTISVGGEKYIGSTTVNFTIEKATVTITAANKSAVVGSAQPELTYTVSGLADGETLDTVPTLTCTPDMNTVGSYPITASGAAVPNTGNYNTTITYVDGTLSVTAKPSTGGGGYVPSNPGGSTITVPVSGDKSTVHVSASVSGTTATVSKIDTSQIENVIGDNGQASMVEIDFTGLGKTIDTVKLPAAAIKDIAAKAQNEEVGGLTVKLPEAEISFDANALSAIQAQAGSQITLTVTPAKPTDLNNRQKEAVGSAPVFDLTLRSSSGAITDFRGGYATVSLPYTLAAGQNPSGVVVYYLDSAGNITPCTTMYDVGRKSAIFTTGHLSLYFVGYDPTAVWVNPFSDVTEGAWYYDAVRYASENGLMGGYGNGKFGPNDNLSRAQFAQILFNKEGRPVVNYLLRYNDVADGAWYTEAVRWATSQGVVSGYGNGMFGPNDNITREQLAVMLWRYAGSPAATEKELHFTDADKASGYALEALRWAVENGVMGGYGNGQLAPQGLATRAQVAQMLMNFLKNR